MAWREGHRYRGEADGPTTVCVCVQCVCVHVFIISGSLLTSAGQSCGSLTLPYSITCSNVTTTEGERRADSPHRGYLLTHVVPFAIHRCSPIQLLPVSNTVAEPQFHDTAQDKFYSISGFISDVLLSIALL